MTSNYFEKMAVKEILVEQVWRENSETEKKLEEIWQAANHLLVEYGQVEKDNHNFPQVCLRCLLTPQSSQLSGTLSLVEIKALCQYSGDNLPALSTIAPRVPALKIILRDCQKIFLQIRPLDSGGKVGQRLEIEWSNFSAKKTVGFGSPEEVNLASEIAHYEDLLRQLFQTLTSQPSEMEKREIYIEK